ncbi:Hypothetical predicted protein [Lynx pardinus]|uniref:Uncharacterized protein n=1 Tax=Lynx pardinus TaxID=191816 RepID=A0A485N6X8_LYNPA|nr:Hypothetical predicted protein [Lynx pardinus]
MLGGLQGVQCPCRQLQTGCLEKPGLFQSPRRVPRIAGGGQMLTHRSPGGSGWQRSAGRRDARAPHEGAEGGRVRADGLPGPENSFLLAPTPAIALQTLSFCPGSGLRPEGCTEPSAADSAPEGHKAQNLEPASDSVSPSPSAPPHSHSVSLSPSLSLSKINKHLKKSQRK